MPQLFFRLWWSIGRTNCSHYSTIVDLYSPQILLAAPNSIGNATYLRCRSPKESTTDAIKTRFNTTRSFFQAKNWCRQVSRSKTPCLESSYTIVIIQNNEHRAADFRLAPSQWETSLQSNTVSLWPGANLESALWTYYANIIETNWRWFFSCCFESDNNYHHYPL